jgi:hypothetical protein
MKSSLFGPEPVDPVYPGVGFLPAMRSVEDHPYRLEGDEAPIDHPVQVWKESLDRLVRLDH